MTARTLDLQLPEAQGSVSKSKAKESQELAKPRIAWRWGVLAALAMALLSFYPQIDLWLTRGANWQGGFAAVAYDEDIYAAYINGLILGHPRRSDPLGGNGTKESRYESLFSIQMIPAYRSEERRVGE